MICDKCKQDKPDVMARVEINDKTLTTADGIPITSPALCTDCCATYPGRAWMRRSS